MLCCCFDAGSIIAYAVLSVRFICVLVLLVAQHAM